MAKSTKTEAEYTDFGTPQRHCAICTMFVEPQACTTVHGKISPLGWCRYFERERAGNVPN